MVRKDVIPNFLMPLIGPTKTPLRSAEDTIFKLIGIILLCINFGEEVVKVVFGAAPILGTEILLSTAFIEKSVKPIEPE